MQTIERLNIRDLRIGDKVEHNGLVVSHRQERHFHVIGFVCDECTDVHYTRATEGIGFTNIERVS